MKSSSMGYIVVTGALGGIGSETSRYLSQRGYDLILMDIHDPVDVLTSLNSDISSFSFKVDVANSDSVDAAFVEIDNLKLEIDGLVNFAGITRDKTLLKMSEEKWDEVLNVNLKSGFLLTKACAKRMLRRGGSIIMIGSTSAHHGNYGQTNYAASKGGLEAFVRSTARELASHAIRVNCIIPGFISTPMTDAIPNNMKEIAINSIPLGRVGAPQDIAFATEFLLSKKSSYMTGSAMKIDGGLRM